MDRACILWLGLEALRGDECRGQSQSRPMRVSAPPGSILAGLWLGHYHWLPSVHSGGPCMRTAGTPHPGTTASADATRAAFRSNPILGRLNTTIAQAVNNRAIGGGCRMTGPASPGGKGRMCGLQQPSASEQRRRTAGSSHEPQPCAGRMLDAQPVFAAGSCPLSGTTVPATWSALSVCIKDYNHKAIYVLQTWQEKEA